MPCNAHGAFSFYMRPFAHQASVACIPSVALHLLAPVVLFVTMVNAEPGPFTTTVVGELRFLYEANGRLNGIQWFSWDHRTYLFLTSEGEMWVWARDILQNRAYAWMTLTDWYLRAQRIPNAVTRPKPRDD